MHEGAGETVATGESSASGSAPGAVAGRGSGGAPQLTTPASATVRWPYARTSPDYTSSNVPAPATDDEPTSILDSSNPDTS